MDLWTAFFLGLAGSLHCAGMCGPLALALPATGTTRNHFLVGRLVYNLGRILTYCALGLICGLMGRTIFLAGLQQAVSIGLGLLLLVGVFASRKLALWHPVTVLLGQVRSRMSTLLRRRTLGSHLGLGLLNGLLPCGLVYVACAGATATGALGRGAAYMATFGAGTLPMILAIGCSGKLIPFRLRLKLLKAVPISVFALALLLILRGLSLGIPYLSPDLSAQHPLCCQP